MTLKIIQVGLGGWGRNWAELVRTAPDLVEVVASAELVPELRELFVETLGDDAGDVHPDLASALAAHPEAEAVLITTAVGGHLPVAREAIAAGRHVLVEKPFGPDRDAAAEVVDLAAAAGVLLAVSQNYRWYPAPHAVRELLRSGEYGEVGSATVRFRRWDNDAPVEGYTHYGIRHPLLVDMSVHHFDLMRLLFGEADDVACFTGNPSWSNYVEPAEAVASIRFRSGVIVDYSGSWVSAAPKTLWGGEWTIECAGGVIEFTSRDDLGLMNDAMWVTPRGGTRTAVDLAEMTWTDRLGSVAELARAIADRDEPSISGRDNLGTLALMDAVVLAAESGATTTVQRESEVRA